MDMSFVIFMLCFSLAFIIPGCVLFWVNHRRKKRYTGVAEGKIIRFEMVYSSSIRGNQPHPVYEYFVDGRCYRKQGPYLSNANLEVGMPISVLYDPNSPYSACIKGYNSKIYIFIGAALVGMGVFMMLIVFLALIMLFMVQ